MVELLPELLGRCRRGEPDAVAALVRRFQASALDLASALVRDAHLAEDAVQSAFVRALASLSDLRDDRAFPGWFRQILRTECHRISRRKRESSLGDADPPTLAGSPAQFAVLAEHRRVVREALASLPRADREAAELFYLEQRSCAEVADALGIPEGTVKRRLHDARNRLRNMLLGLAESDDDQETPRHPTKAPDRLANRPPL